MMQHLHDQTDKNPFQTSDEPKIKRLKTEDVRDTPHTAENLKSGTSDEANGSESRLCPLQRVVFIDSTWNQTTKISTDERLQGNDEWLHLCNFSKSSDSGQLCGQMFFTPNSVKFDITAFLCFFLELLRVELKMRKTCFWRHQKGKPDTYLATIEAIYYFLTDFHKHWLAEEYNGEYDNLLFYYSYLHSVVNKSKTLAGKTWNQLKRLMNCNSRVTCKPLHDWDFILEGIWWHLLLLFL